MSTTTTTTSRAHVPAGDPGRDRAFAQWRTVGRVRDALGAGEVFGIATRRGEWTGRDWLRCEGRALALAVERAAKRGIAAPRLIQRDGEGWGTRRAAAAVESGSRAGVVHVPVIVCGDDRRLWASCSCEATVLCAHVAALAVALGLVPGPEATPAALPLPAADPWDDVDAVEHFAPYARRAA